jgi:hypothetical protein
MQDSFVLRNDHPGQTAGGSRRAAQAATVIAPPGWVTSAGAVSILRPRGVDDLLQSRRAVFAAGVHHGDIAGVYSIGRSDSAGS